MMLPARDGATLAATLFEPAGSACRGAVLLNSGTGIPRQFYAAFATHLATHGLAVLAYDYRGVGGSPKAPNSTMEQWGAIDQASMLEHLARLCPGAPLGLIGHSFGGQVLGLADNIGSVRAAVLLTSQSGHWRDWPAGRARLRMLALWWLLIPGLTAITGRFPGSWIGTADLPADIARSWARWGRSRHYVCDDRGQPLRPHNHAVTFPIRWISFADDPVAPLSAVEALRSYYPAAAVERLHLAPADLGVPAVGHFGFFRKSMPRPAWDELATWLNVRLQETPADGQTARRHELEDGYACRHPMCSPRSRTASAG
ncbi:MAG: alpha/beta fold hydrolase [Pseudomonadota bacterium]